MMGALKARGEARRYVGLHHWSTWMIVIGMMPVVFLAHQSLFAALGAIVILCWQFIIREVSRFEVSEKISYRCIATSVGVMLIVLVMMTRISWVAL